MNKINLIITLIFIGSFQVLAQKDIIVKSNSREVGKNSLTGESVIANEYTFPERIHDYQIDTVNEYLTVHLRKLSKNGKWLNLKGDVIRYDTDKKKVLWSKRISYEFENIEQYGGITIHSTGGKSYCLDNITGRQQWEVKNSLVFADPVDKIGIGYKIESSQGNENILEGINLMNGQPIWQRKISREYGWNDVFYLNDSILLIVASGLHTLNIFDGTGWGYDAVTGKKDYTASAVGTGLGIAAGLLTGTYAVSTGHNLVRDIVSNVILDSLNIYFASKEHLIKLNRKGEELWKKSLPGELTSKSLIFKSGDDLIMVNRGYAYMGYRQIDFGTSYIASFNINTGDQKYLETLTNKKKDIIKGIDRNDNELILIFNDYVSKYSISEGQLITKQIFNIDKYGELNYFIGEQVFVQKDSLFLSLPSLDTTKSYLYTRKEKILILNSNLEVESEIDTENIYVYYFNMYNKRFIAKNNNTYVIDLLGKKIAEFTASSKSIFVNGKLYDTQDKSFLEINLENIINNGP